MIDIKKDIYEMLNTLDYKVNYYYPQSFTNLPIITFYIINNTERYCDKLAEITVAIDVWTKDSPTNIVADVNNLMLNAGFKRILCQDMYETDTKIYHECLRYFGVINTNKECFKI